MPRSIHWHLRISRADRLRTPSVCKEHYWGVSLRLAPSRRTSKRSPLSFVRLTIRLSQRKRTDWTRYAVPVTERLSNFSLRITLSKYKYKDAADQQEEVRKAFLGSVIEKHIDQDRIKQCAKRAAWLGNDQTHYTRKWEDKDIHDLKSLIMMTLNHIDLTIESDRYLREMP